MAFVPPEGDCLRAALPLALGLLLFLWGAEQGRLLLAAPLHLVMLGDFADPLAYFTLLGLLALLGLRALRLSFTTENAGEVDKVLADWVRGGTFEPGSYTRGLYQRGVE